MLKKVNHFTHICMFFALAIVCMAKKMEFSRIQTDIMRRMETKLIKEHVLKLIMVEDMIIDYKQTAIFQEINRHSTRE